MSFIDKAKNTAEKVTGEVKEAVGKATDDKDLQAEGNKDQAKGSLKNAGEDVKDAFKK
ncbi:MAG: CsbD family protein [Propionibacteriales bacterium]|nr:CsbD family protein [Propionibacteriales bacterium]